MKARKHKAEQLEEYFGNSSESSSKCARTTQSRASDAQTTSNAQTNKKSPKGKSEKRYVENEAIRNSKLEVVIVSAKDRQRKEC